MSNDVKLNLQKLETTCKCMCAFYSCYMYIYTHTHTQVLRTHTHRTVYASKAYTCEQTVTSKV